MNIIEKEARKIVFYGNPLTFSMVFNRKREDGRDWVIKEGEGNFQDWFCKIEPEKNGIYSSRKFDESMLMTFEEALKASEWHCEFNDRSEVF